MLLITDNQINVYPKTYCARYVAPSKYTERYWTRSVRENIRGKFTMVNKNKYIDC